MPGYQTEPEDMLSSDLPALVDAPFRTPSRSSRRSRRSATPEISSSPPPPMPSERTDRHSKRSSRDVVVDESISILDPRRFTPTLHANLVSEILNLRRDQEEKLKFIEGLETTLHTTREEQESLQSALVRNAKESRSLKRQLALLEGGTSSALGELSRERDDAVEAITDTKKRLEVAQKKVRSQEEDFQKTHELWAKEKDGWEEERRKYERKLHAADTRLKAILDEVARHEVSQSQRQQQNEPEPEDGVRDSDAASIRSMGTSVRYSVVPDKTNGQSLADELNFDDDEEYETEPDGRQSVMSQQSHHHMRNFSRESVLSKTAPKAHRRNLSSESYARPGSVTRARAYMNQSVLERLEGQIREDDEDISPPAPKPEYTETGVQFSPPPSPKLAPVKKTSPELDGKNAPKAEWEANQSRKRVHVTKPLPIEPQPVSKTMVSTSSQTLNEPLSPPATPVIPLQVVSLPAVEVKPLETTQPQMITSGTQTDVKPHSAERSRSPSPLLVPSISIHPPTSRTSSPRPHRLPQYVKDFGCQVTILEPVPTSSIAIQTDEIRVDTRLDKLPAHLHPSAISSRPVSRNPPLAMPTEDLKTFTPVPGHLPPRNPRRLTSQPSFSSDLAPSPPVSPNETRDVYPGNNDNGSLSSRKAPVRRPHRISSLFAGFEAASSDEDDLAGSDSEFRTALSSPQSKPSKHKQNESIVTTSTIDQAPEILKQARNTIKQMSAYSAYNGFSLGDDRKSHGRKPSGNKPSAYRTSVMRKSAMIQNGIASHQGRSRSPSLQNLKDPPFPIPTRASSRQPGMSVRSSESVASSQPSQPASGVVEAIAQTMVGEWMFKYVRRRKSFGMAETKAEENSNDRHKRWVWLAPYERAILWSSKQPSSGSALMGKAGRKLTIQSVLDVKDDNSPPKGAGQIFNRSILILTPQRALKFTAVTAERHYLWLTALAFLAHSQQAVPDIISPAAPAPTGPTAAKLAPAPTLAPNIGPPPPPKAKKSGIRDSIMLKKSRSPTTPSDSTSSPKQLGDAIDFQPDTLPAMLNHQRDLSRDVAEPPFIPRFHDRSSERVHERANQVVLHGRKRSNTGGHHVPPPLSFRGFSSPQASHHKYTDSTAGNSVVTTGSSDLYQPSTTGHSTWAMSSAASRSQRTSDASSRPGNNFFEAIGTIRMEAFISPLAFPRVDEHPEDEEVRYRARRRSKDIRRQRSRSRQREQISYGPHSARGTDDFYGGSRASEEDYFRDDPFKGF
ncbi:hypothetical protein KJ359_012893 [Pestalotiopsis sp. 9143b]|nr:hypothetical protein KJ359_012893 [Pestalotiopsis sp. 9143b]